MAIDTSALSVHFPNPQDGFTTTASGTVSSGASTVGLNSTGDYSNGDIVVLIIDPADTNKKQVFVGTIDTSGTQVTGVVWVGGTNQQHANGATIVDYYDAAHIKMMTKGMLVQHKQDGTHANTITTNTINENTPGNGVTIDSLNIKDGKLNTANAVDSDAYTDNSIDAEHLATTAIKIGAQSNTSTTVITAAAGDVVVATLTVTIPTGGRDLELAVAIPDITAGGAALGTCKVKTGGSVGGGVHSGGTTLTAFRKKWQDSGDVNNFGFSVFVSAPTAGSTTYYLTLAAASSNLQHNLSSTAPGTITAKMV